MPWDAAGHRLYRVPKTGSSWLVSALVDLLGASSVGGAHTPRSRHPEGARVPVGTTRDPWSWYVSWWLHCSNLDAYTRGQLEAIGGGSAAFRDVLWGATHGRLASKVGVICNAGKRRDVPTDVGLWTWLHRWVYGGGPILLTDQAALAEGAREVFGGAPADWQRPPVNTAAQRGRPRVVLEGPAEALYDDEMRQWVADADAGLIAALGCTPFGPAAQPVTRLEL